MTKRTEKIVSTRSNLSDDARRDMDNFDVDEELRRFRKACLAKQWIVAAELAANIDENVSRGGPWPVAWLGPLCMQKQSDRRYSHKETVSRAKKMTAKQREGEIWGYVDVLDIIGKAK